NFVSLKTSANVYVTQENKYEIRIEAPPDVMDRITTEVSDNTLEIDRKNDWNSDNHKQIKIYVSMPKPNGFEVDGSGSIITQNKITTDYLLVQVNGSGDINAGETASEKLMIQVEGSGAIRYKNALAENAMVEVNGSGDIRGDQLMSKLVSISMGGSGQIKFVTISSEKISMMNE